MNGKIIDLTADEIKINSDNFEVDKTGKIKATAGTIGGYDISQNDLSAELYTDYSYTTEDLNKIQQYIMGKITLTDEEKERLDFYRDGVIDSRDYLMIKNIVNGISGVDNTHRGKITIQRKNHMKAIVIIDGFGNEIFRTGIAETKCSNLVANKINNAIIKEQKVLWGPDFMYMLSGQTITLSEPISSQPNGIILVWSAYVDGEPQDYNFNSFFISKKEIELFPGNGHNMIMAGSPFNPIASKYVYITDTTISGNDDNNLSGTRNGITFANNKFVLRYVIGV